MSNKGESLQRSVSHWAHALRLLGTEARGVQALAAAARELSDDLLTGSPSGMGETEWFQLSGRRLEVILDDGLSMIRLANRRVARDLYGTADFPLVSWFGCTRDAYELDQHILDAQGATGVSGPNRVLWAAWNSRAWRPRFFDGSRLLPFVFAGATGEMNAGRGAWMGWDGEDLDVFTATPAEIPASTMVLVGEDGSVIATRRRHTPDGFNGPREDAAS